MKKHDLLEMMCAFTLTVLVMMCAFTLVSSTATDVISSNKLGEDVIQEELLNEDTTDVPTWRIGDSWTYHQDTLQDNYTWHDTDYMHIIETVTYTVSEIGWFEYENKTHYAYNLTLDGTVSGDSSGQSNGYAINIQSGTTTGWQLIRVSDLALIGDYQERDIDGTVSCLAINIYTEQNRAYDPPYEVYNFPLSRGNDFWANSTCDIWGYYETSGAAEEQDTFGDTVDYIQEIGVANSYTSVAVPGGTFDTYYVANYMNSSDGTDKGQGYVKNWYDADVGNYVKQKGLVANFMSRDTQWTFEYIEHTRASNPNSQNITPQEATIGDTVTVSGQFPGYPNEAITITIPEGATPVSEWYTMTDGNGNYSLDIEVPDAQDDAETLEYYSSVGLVTYLDIDHTEMVVTTLVIHEPVITQSISMNDGWNFVSTNLVPAHENLVNILDDPEYGIAGNYSKFMLFDAEQQRWSSYVPGRATHFNTYGWNRTMGFWIFLDVNATLTVEGQVPESTDITLYPGWNMVGLPSSTAGNHGLPTEVTKIGYFDATATYNLSYDYAPESYEFQPGRGYWIYNGASEPVIWNVNY